MSRNSCNGIKVIETSPTWSKTGEKAEITCYLDQEAYACVFIDPQGTEYCSPSSYDGARPGCSPAFMSRYGISVKDKSCSLLISRLEDADFGPWQCKALYWTEWTQPSKIDINRFEEAMVEFKNFPSFSDLLVESGKKQTFVCELSYSGTGDGIVQWFITSQGKPRIELSGSGNHDHEIKLKEIETVDGWKIIESSLEFIPTVEDDDKNVICFNPQSGEEDHVSLGVFLLEAPSNIPDKIVAYQGEKKRVSIHISSYPPPEVVWNLDSGQYALAAGDTSEDGRFHAEEVKFVGKNEHEISLVIDTNLDDDNTEHSLQIKVVHSGRLQKKMDLPFTLKVKKMFNDESRTNTSTNGPIINGEKSKTENPPNVQTQGLGLWIILAILAILIILCCIFCCARKRGQKNKQPVEIDIEKKSNQVENVGLLKTDSQQNENGVKDTKENLSKQDLS